MDENTRITKTAGLDPAVELGLLKQCEHLIGATVKGIGFKYSYTGSLVVEIWDGEGHTFTFYLDERRTINRKSTITDA